MEHFDVAIIGLGPAGAALARQLAGRMRVIAPDKKREQGTEGFTKPCGGLLASDAQRSLIRAGLTLPISVIANRGSTPEPPKFPLPQFQPGNQRIQVNNFIAALEGIMSIQQNVLPGHR